MPSIVVFAWAEARANSTNTIFCAIYVTLTGNTHWVTIVTNAAPIVKYISKWCVIELQMKTAVWNRNMDNDKQSPINYNHLLTSVRIREHRIRVLNWYDKVTIAELMERTNQIPVYQEVSKR